MDRNSAPWQATDGRHARVGGSCDRRGEPAGAWLRTGLVRIGVGLLLVPASVLAANAAEANPGGLPRAAQSAAAEPTPFVIELENDTPELRALLRRRAQAVDPVAWAVQMAAGVPVAETEIAPGVFARVEAKAYDDFAIVWRLAPGIDTDAVKLFRPPLASTLRVSAPDIVGAEGKTSRDWSVPDDAGVSALPARVKERDASRAWTEVRARAVVPFATFSVTNTNDSGAGSLRAAMDTALASFGPHVITISATGTINLASALPQIHNTALSVNGPGANQLTINRASGGDYSIFSTPLIVYGRALAFSGMRIQNGSSGSSGGGIAITGGSLTLNGLVLANNAAASAGGGLSLVSSSATITDTTFTGNSTGLQGSAINAQASPVIISNSTFSANSVTDVSGSGGAIFNFGLAAPTMLTNTTFSGNTTANSTRGQAIVANNLIQFRNTIFSGAAPQIAGTGAGSLGNNICSDNSGGLVSADDLPNTNPLLSALGNHGGTTLTHALLPGSPAINAGTASGAPTEDQRGIARAGNVDIGAFESRGFTLTRTAGHAQTTPINTIFPTSLVATASSGVGEPVQGGRVRFTAPGSGATAVLGYVDAVINASGQAINPAGANGIGGTYDVVANANGNNGAALVYTLTNVAPPQLSIGDVSIGEGNGGTQILSFTVTRTGPAADAVGFTFATADDTANAGSDYVATSGTASIAAGGTTGSTTVAVTINGDVMFESDERFFVNLSAPAGGAQIADGQAVGTITDDDAAPTLAINDVSVVEGNSGTTGLVFTVTRTGSTALPASFSATAADGTATAPGDYLATLTGATAIAAGGATGTTTLTATINGDVVVEPNETFLVNLSAPDGATIADGQGVGTILNDDTAGVTVVQSAGTTIVTEGGATDTYTVVLTSQPTADVTIAVTGDAQVTPAPASLVFTPVNWNDAQTVTVSAVDDAMVEGPHSGAITHVATSADTNYSGVPVPGITASITDNDTAGATIVESGGATTATEGGATDAYTIVLTSQPTADVTIAVAGDTQVTAAPSSLVFTTANWNLTQTVTVTAIDDALIEGPHGGALDHSVTSSDTNYSSVVIPSVVAAITDNDTAGVTIVESGGMTTVTEGGATDIYAVSLTSQPTADVTIAVAGDAQVAPTPTSVVFTAANWNVAQAVTVTAVDDAAVEGPHGGLLSHTAASSDANYDGIAVPGITAAIVDNDSAGVSLVQSGGTTTITEGGATDTYTVVLTSQPAANVTIAVAGDPQVTAAPSGLVFTTANWNVMQTVTVTAIDDAIVEGAHSGTLSHTATSADSNYDGIGITNVTVAITDNDTAGMSIVETGGTTTVTEGGATDTYTVVLTSQPTASVTIAVVGDAQLTPAPASVIFTAANWSVAQTVTVTAVDDAIVEGPHSGTLVHAATSGDINYDGIAIINVTAVITDNDSAGISVVQSGGDTQVTEGGATDTYSVVLTSQPTADVAITVTGDAQVTAVPTSLTFTTANWNVAQTVTVTAVDDAVVEGPHSGTLSHAATSGDAGYDGIAIINVTASITDDDLAGVSVVQSGGDTHVNEGGAADTYAVVLTSQPAASVTIAVAGDAQVMAAPASLVFTTASWNVAQTVTVTAVDDDDVEGTHSGTLAHTASSGDAAYDGIAITSIVATITDDDRATATVVASKALLQAGTTQLPARYRITLTNTGAGAQPDDPSSDELIDVLPSTLVLRAATADAGTITLDLAANTVRWNGAIPATTGQVVIDIRADVATRETTLISNQATIRYDGDGDGGNDATALSSDPALPGVNQPTSFTFVGSGTGAAPAPIAIPADGRLALLLLAMLVLAAAGGRLQRRKR